MYKLRQRNANVVRFAEWDKGREEIYLDRKIETVSADALSEQLASLCADTEYIYTRQTDLQVGRTNNAAPYIVLHEEYLLAYPNRRWLEMSEYVNIFVIVVSY